MTSLLLDGVAVRGKNLKVTANFKIESDNLSGQTSSTASNLKGFKPTVLTVSLQIKYDNQAYLESIISLARAVTGGGKRKVYRVVNKTAAAFGMKQVEFTDNFSARQDDSLKQWQVQFNLTEHISTPERVESRQQSSKVEQQQTPGVPIEEKPEQAEELTSWEKILKRVDSGLEGKV